MSYLKELVVKSNELIEMPVDFNLMQLKLFAKVVVSIRENSTKDYYRFQVKDLLKDFGLSSTNYTQLKLATKGLIRPVVIKGEDGSEQQKAFFTDVNYSNKGIVEFRIHPDLKPFILDLEKDYTKYYLSNIARLKSSYTIRFYELLKQYQFRGNRLLTIIEIRKFLKIDDSKYKQYGHLKSKVILVAQKEIEEKTDIYFEFEEIKEGRKTVAIKFLIYKNTNDIEGGNIEAIAFSEDPLNSVLNNQQKKLLGKLVSEYKVSEKIANELIESVSLEQIEKNIAYTKNEHKKGKISQNFTGYLLKAIKENYASKISLFEDDEKDKKDELKRSQELAERKESYQDKISKEFSKEQKELFIKSLDDNAKEKLILEILENVKNDSFAVKHISKKGLTSPSAYLGIINKIDDFEGKKKAYIKVKMKEAGF